MHLTAAFSCNFTGCKVWYGVKMETGKQYYLKLLVQIQIAVNPTEKSANIPISMLFHQSAPPAMPDGQLIQISTLIMFHSCLTTDTRHPTNTLATIQDT